MAQCDVSQSISGVSHASAPANGQHLVTEFCQDTELVERLGVTPEEIQALSQSSLLGSISSRQDVLFMLRTIRSCLAPGAGEDNIAAVASELVHEMRRGAAARLHHSIAFADVDSPRRWWRVGVGVGAVALASVLYRVVPAVISAMPRISPLAVAIFGAEAVLSTALCLYVRHLIAKIRTLLNAKS